MRKGVLIAAIAGVVLVVAIVIIALSQSQQSAQTEQNTQSESQASTNTKVETTNSITIKDMDFSPKKTTIKRGTTVTWTNEDSVGHNVLASDSQQSGGLPNSAPLLQKGQTFSHTFNEIGNFAYHCGPHPNMRGAIEVIE